VGVVDVSEPIHLYWPGFTQSVCGQALRRQDAVARSLEISPAYVPIVRHWEDFCPRCLRLVEVGPTDAGANRCQPAFAGYAINEREATKVGIVRYG
jgi:hypothetical protein